MLFLLCVFVQICDENLTLHGNWKMSFHFSKKKEKNLCRVIIIFCNCETQKSCWTQILSYTSGMLYAHILYMALVLSFDFFCDKKDIRFLWKQFFLRSVFPSINLHNWVKVTSYGIQCSRHSFTYIIMFDTHCLHYTTSHHDEEVV